MKRSLALAGLLGTIGLSVMGLACDKKKGPSEEPTQGDADGNESSNASAGGVVVEDPGKEPAEESPADGAVEPIDHDDLQYEGTVEVVAGTVPCTTDADCVPAECCHPSTCVAAASKPDCSATMCTLECRSGTMDCFGGCLCGEDKKCAAKIWTASGG